MMIALGILVAVTLVFFKLIVVGLIMRVQGLERRIDGIERRMVWGKVDDIERRIDRCGEKGHRQIEAGDPLTVRKT